MKAKLAVFVALVASVAALAPAAGAEPDEPPNFSKGNSTRQEVVSAELGAAPNIVVIITDDQAKGTMDAMPNVRGLIRDQGVTLETGIIPTALCCPSRTSLLSGRYSHDTGVYQNVGTHGGWPTFNQSGAEATTFATALHDAGYKTGMFGKYLNGFMLADADYVPPGWDQFRAIQDRNGSPALAAGAYFDYWLHGTGGPSADVHYGSQPADYSTDVITDHAVDFINATPDYVPFLLYYSTTGAHAPFTPAPRHEGDWHDEALSPAATTLTENRPDFWPDDTVNYQQQVDRLRRQHEALLSVDEGVGDIFDALGPDRIDDTLFVFLSDNGLQFGEHGLKEKNAPFNGSTEVPMFLRWDGHIAAGSTYSRPVTGADLGVTIAQAGGVSIPGATGVSYFANNRPEGVVLEATANSERPAYCGWRTQRFLYVEYSGNAGREMYDYNNDPDELNNVVGNSGRADKVAELKAAAKAACSPRPPGFTWAG